jgi:3-oxoacyl-[acyl-carrier protein] reductase
MSVLITGAAKGLGREFATSFIKAGYPVLAHYCTSEKEAQTLGCETVQGDFSTREGIERFCKSLQGRSVAHIIHNVGNYKIASAQNSDISSWESLFYTNLLAPTMITKALLPSVIEAKGSLIFIGSTGLAEAEAYSTAYTALKAALLSYAKSLAKELIATGVSVNMVSPGVLPNSVDHKNFATLPQGKAVFFDEVARLALFLVDKENRSITGQNIEVAGGLRL